MRHLRVRFTRHAIGKFTVLAAHGLHLSADMVTDIVQNPSKILPGYAGRLVAQGPLDEGRVLRVVYEETPGDAVVITFYPARRGRYE